MTNHLTIVRQALELAGKATPGKWAKTRSAKRGSWCLYPDGGGEGFADVNPGSEFTDMREGNADAIIALKNATPSIAAICDENERQARELSEAKAALDEAHAAYLGVQADEATLTQRLKETRAEVLEEAAAWLEDERNEPHWGQYNNLKTAQTTVKECAALIRALLQKPKETRS